MSAKENFESLKDKYEAIANIDVKEPNLPIHIAIDEALDLRIIALQDQDKLATTDLQIELIEELLLRAEGLRYAQGIWTQEYQSKTEIEEEWKNVSTTAFELRDELLHYCKYAYRKNPKLMIVVENIAQGTSNSDMVMDLSELSILGKDNPAPLEAINFDLSKLDQAAALSDQCGKLMSLVNGTRATNNKPSKQVRDRAFTYLKEAVDAVREAGKFIFWKDRERLEQYSSEYFRKINQKRKIEEEPA